MPLDKKSENRYIFRRNEYKRVISEKSTTSTHVCLGHVEHWIEEIEKSNLLHGSVAQSKTVFIKYGRAPGRADLWILIFRSESSPSAARDEQGSNTSQSMAVH